ncbi:MAG: PQQ-dependent sugar dehydrogenase, partial [Cyclobacteriaceae bacterium]|nr:PQQ-dependent sugar dehydrogenase [Cyclobacteriaceae bacterium]
MGLTHCQQKALPDGDPDNGGLFLPDGFEAVVVVDSIGSARHLAVNDNGDIYVKLRYPSAEGENIAMRDQDHDGKADVIELFGNYGQEGAYGTAMRIYQGYLYFSTAGRVMRHKLVPGKLVPEDQAEVIMIDDYKNAEHGYEHIAKPITFDNEGHLYVPFGAPGDVCQELNRRPGAPGQDPCPELEWHGGVWQFDANKPGQTQQDGYRYATGIRSIVGMEWNPVENELYALQHGRDNMHRMWPEFYSPWESAMLPAEELLRVTEGSDAGWPYYYYDQMQGKKLLNPEYGGDGQKEGQGADYLQPLIGFPGHWAPNDIHFYQGDQFPERYRNGAFIAFHGSTIRDPYPQAGYFIGFVPFENGVPSGPWEVFADGFSKVDTIITTSESGYRPMGIAMGPDGSLYVSESEEGKIWRIMFKGDKQNFGTAQLAKMEERKQQPNIKTPDEVSDDLTSLVAEASGKLYIQHCAACHMADGKGDGVRFPPLDESEWVSGDKKRLIGIILNGMDGSITVKGETFVGNMPGFDYLTDRSIAQILTYIRSNFNNNAVGVREDEVRRIRRASQIQ